eukprot:516340-Alexandrium_andersonii.AAC.1
MSDAGESSSPGGDSTSHRVRTAAFRFFERWPAPPLRFWGPRGGVEDMGPLERGLALATAGK